MVNGVYLPTTPTEPKMVHFLSLNKLIMETPASLAGCCLLQYQIDGQQEKGLQYNSTLF